MSMERRLLFGGAIEAELPSNFQDVSVVRDVPDNQEVFADANSDASLIVELLSRVEARDEDSAAFHFNVLAEDNSASNPHIFQIGVAPPDVLPHIGQNSYKALLYGQQQVSKFREHAPNTVDIYLCCLRLQEQDTDVLITLNTPVSINPASSSSATTPQQQGHPALSQHVFAHFLKTFLVKDWGLFM